jgi:hypothetical protein
MAVPLFRELVERAPSVWTYHFHLAIALIQGSGVQSAIGELRSALGCNPPADKRNQIQTLIELAGSPK